MKPFQLIVLCTVLLAGAGALVASPGAVPHWAFQPISRATPPETGTAWGKGAIDQIVGDFLSRNKSSPAPPAGARPLLRRITFDLTGLPPAPEDLARFESAFRENPDAAVEAAIDRLLASPAYGERWARWWLDVARYADTNGQDENKVMANAWRYRDWVIRAFNSNLPFDQFIQDQVAGDLLPPGGHERENVDRLIATGFLVLGPKMLAEQDKTKLVMDVIDEQIDTVGKAFMGLTLGCARCHDHKFDPVSTADYYAMAGIFKSTRTMQDLSFVSKFNERSVATRAELDAIATHARQEKELDQRIAQLVENANTALVREERLRFPVYLTAANGGIPPASGGLLHAGRVDRLKAALAPGATNSTLSARGSTLLRGLLADPGRQAGFLERLENESREGTGLRLGPGKHGTGFLSTGHNHLDIPHKDRLDPATLTVEAWVRADAFPREGEPRRWLVNKNGNEWVEGHYALMLDGDQAGAYLNIGGTKEDVFAVWSGSSRLKAGQWHHLAFTYDGSVLRLYLDGEPSGETAVNRPRKPGSTPLTIGRRQDGYIAFAGSLDDVRIYDRPLPASTLMQRAAKGQPGVDDGWVERWNFDTLTESQQEQVAMGELHSLLLGPDGIFALPKDPKSQYPASTKQAIASLETERDRLRKSAPSSEPMALSVRDDSPVDVPVHLRGNHLTLATNPVPRGFIPVVFKEGVGKHPVPSGSSGRLQLARWLTDPDNPLTARVIVNRFWQAHFGEGLVRTADNFGLRGEPPILPALLDALARDFIRSGWDVKALHRAILTSATYRQGSRPDPDAGSAKPEVPLARFPRQRLEAEMIRDSLLAISGRLDTAAGGPPADWKNNEYVPGDDISAKSLRRTVYLPIVRDRVYDALTLFDFANPSVCSARRTPTVVSHQALFFLNSPLVKESCDALAGRLVTMPGATRDSQVEAAWLQVLGRAPEAGELHRALQFLDRLATLPPDGKSSDQAARLRQDLSTLCQGLFASNEFLHLH